MSTHKDRGKIYEPFRPDPKEEPTCRYKSEKEAAKKNDEACDAIIEDTLTGSAMGVGAAIGSVGGPIGIAVGAALGFLWVKGGKK